MLVKIYIIGFIIIFIWWGLLSNIVFGKKAYENSSQSIKDSVDEIHNILEQFSIVNPQFTYFFFSLVISFIWPLIIVYFILKKIVG